MAGDWNWGRLATVSSTTAMAGIGAALILTSATAPKWALAFSGILVVGAAAGLAVLCVVAWIAVEELRLSVMYRKPRRQVSLTHRESSFPADRHYRHHPVRFWLGISSGQSWFVGLILFDPPKHEHLYLDREGHTDGEG